MLSAISRKDDSARDAVALSALTHVLPARVVAAVVVLALLFGVLALVRPTGTALALSHVGTGALASSTGTSLSVPLPGGTQLGDLLMLGCQGRNNSMNWSATGYTNLSGPIGPAGTRLELQYKWATASEPGSITVTNTSGLNGWSCSITALRGGVGSGSPLDAAPASQLATSATMTAPSVITASNGALVTRWFASADDNSHGSPSAGSLAFGGTAYQTVTGVDHASSMSFLTKAVAGPTGTATMQQTANAADPSVGITIALKPGGVVPPGPSAATVDINPGGGIGASTFDADSFQIDNTGANPITSVVINLASAFLPDLRFDPVGQAGDNLAMCLTPSASSDAVGFLAPANLCTTPFSGGTASTGYTTLTMNFNNFGPGEQFNFSVDVDPTTIKGFASAGNAGAISGLELAGTTSTITFSTGAQTSQTFGDGSQGGSDANVPSAVTQAVGLSVSGVTTTDGGYSNGADTGTVTTTAQSAVLTAPNGTPVSLIVVDAVLEDAPAGGFNDLDPIERNKAVSVTYLTATVGVSGSVSIPFSVSDVAGEATYLLAAVTGPSGTTGPVGSPIYLELDDGPPPPGPSAATVDINPGGGIGASTFDADSFQIDNTGANPITSVVINLASAFLPDLRFDPVGQAGDNLAMCLTPSASSDAVGFLAPANLCTTPFSGGTASTGYTTLTMNFNNFGPGEQFNFSVDVDPTTIKGFASAGNAGAISGLELAGTTSTITFSTGAQTSQTFGDGSQGGSDANVPSAVTQAVGLSVSGVTTTDGGYSNGADTGTVTTTAQSAVLTAPNGTPVSLIVVDAVLEDAPAGGFNDLDPIERNKAVSVTYLTATVGVSGSVSIPFSVSDVAGEATYLLAAVTGPSGTTGPVGSPIYLELDDGPPPPGGEWSLLGTGALASSTGTSLSVPLPGGTQLGDLLMLGCQGRNNSMNWSATGYTNLSGPIGPAGTRLELQYKWATASEPGSITVTNTSGLNGWSCSITALRGGVGSGSPLDAAPASQLATSATMTAPSVITASNGALVTRWFASADDNSHGSPSAGSLAFGGTAYQTVTGVDHASSMSFLTKAVAGPTGTATMQQTANAADPSVGITIALKPGGVVPPGPSAATVDINPGGGIGASTFDADSFQIDNTGANPITSVVINLASAFLPDLRFDPVGQAGDNLAMCLTPSASSDAVGFLAPANLCTTPFSGGTASTGYTTLTMNFNNFGPGEQFNFSVDVDPTTIKGFASAGNAGAISGLELAGTTSTITFSTGAQTSQTFGDGSQGGSDANVPSAVTQAVGLSVSGVTTTDGGYSNGADTGTVTTTAQSAVLTAPNGTPVSLIVVDAVLEDAPAGGFNDLDPIERNKAVSVTYLTATVGVSGSVSIPFSVSDVAGEATYLLAAVTGPSGTTGPVGSPIYLELDDGPPPPGGAVLYRVNAGGPQIAAIDGGPVWDADTSAANHANLADPGSNDNAGFPGVESGPTVPSTTPGAIFDTERWDNAGGTEMQWEFPVAAGTQVQVRLYMGNGYPGTSAPGQRIFDVLIDGVTKVNDRDLSQMYGHEVGAMEAFTITSDGTVDIDFVHGSIENPLINGIEIVSVGPTPNTLGVSPPDIDFGPVVFSSGSEAHTVTLTNLGAVGDPSIQVTGIVLGGSTDFSLTDVPTTPFTLIPGASDTVQVTYDPASAAFDVGTLTITHSGANTPVVVDLDGEGVSNLPVGFGSSGLSGESLGSPTSLDFGPDGRLYVSEQDGDIFAYTITRTGANDYDITATETITLVKGIQNHNDNGSITGVPTTRQVTGILAVGTALNPVLYVTSSDPRISVGTDSGLDTNSGTLSRLTWNGSTWDHVQLVRGLPRSEENHATNGMDLDPVTNTLYVMQGGLTNKGAPGNNFSGRPEYALSGAMLSIDLDFIDANMPTLTDAHGASYKYNLETLDDPTREDGLENDPWGGNNGRNQAIIVAGGPVHVFSPGYRNPYDVVFTEAGKLYTFDNGPNTGWGGIPVGEGTANCTNAFNESSSDGFGDGLHYVTDGYYGGHPNPTRGNANSGLIIYVNSGGSWVAENTYAWSDFPAPPVPAGEINAIECDYQSPGGDNDALAVIGASTNGITEYTASNFGGNMQGDLLAASFNGNVYRFQLNAAGDDITSQGAIFSGFGSTPLDVTAQDDSEIFPGTVWAVTYGSNNVTVFEPNDFGGGGGSCTGADNALLDEDSDGFDNADEIDNLTDPCSAASKPPDADGDFTSNLNDPDDDNDGLPDTSDPFAVDANQAVPTVVVPATCPVDQSTSSAGCLRFNAASFPGSLLDLGFTGLMTNGVSDYEALFDPGDLITGGAAGVLSVQNVTAGDAVSTSNNQDNGFQFGAVVPGDPFTVHTKVIAPFPTAAGNPPDFQSVGMFIGDGTQANYIKLVVSANGGAGGIQFASESANAFTDVLGTPFDDSGVKGDGVVIDLYLEINPATGQVAASYSLNGGTTVVDIGSTTSAATWLDTGNTIAIGVLSTKFNAPASSLTGSWDLLETYLTAAPPAPVATFRVNVGGPTVASVDAGPAWSEDTTATPSPYWVANGTNIFTTADGNSTGPVMSGPLPHAIFNDERWDSGVSGDPVADELRYSFPVAAGAAVDVKVYLAEIYNGISGAGQRFFDIAVDGVVPAPFNNLDPYALGGNAASVGSVVTASVISDGSVDLTFLHQTENPNPKAIEIIVTAAAAANLAGPASVDFGPVSVGDTNTQTITLSNPIGSNGPVNITALAATGTGFSLGTAPALPVTLNPGQSVNVDVAFAPTSVGPFTGSLQATHTGASGSLSVALSGDGSPILFRINAGGPALAATDDAPNWEADTEAAPSPYHNTGSNVGEFPNDNGIDASVPSTTPTSGGTTGSPNVFVSERWDPGAVGDPTTDEMQWNFPVPNAQWVEVRLYFHNGYDGTNGLGLRKFDVALEGTTVLPNYDIWAEVGHRKGVMKSFVVQSNGTIDIDFFHVTENPLVNAIEIIMTSAPVNAAPVCAGDLATVTGGESLNDSVACTDADAGDTLTYSMVGDVSNGLLTFNPGGSFSYAPDPGFFGSDSFTFKANDGTDDSNVATFSITVNPEPGLVLYRVNAGGPAVTATDGGPNWAIDDDANPSPLHNNAGSTTSDHGAVGSVAISVPFTTPNAIFSHERWDPGAEDDLLPDELQWDFTVPAGTQVEVRLYFRNGYGGTSGVGERVFDVSLEDSVVLPLYDIVADVGHNVGTMQSFVLTSDGNIDLDLIHHVENPLINGIEILIPDPEAAQVVYRVNTGGPAVTPISGPSWSVDSDNGASASPHRDAGGTNLFGTGDTITLHSSVPSGTPMALFQSERWDGAEAPEMLWTFPVESGATYEVRLYLAEIFITSSGGTPRIFDIQFEGASAVDPFNDVNLFATYGHDVGVMLFDEVTMADTSLDILFVHVSENPNVKAIEILKLP